MFGYVLPRNDRLTPEQKERYHAAYCGLCRSLRLHYGFRARFLVNYDMTFLYFLLQRKEGLCAQRCFCPARVVCRKECLPADGVMRTCADLSVLLSYWKLRDARSDGGGMHRLAAGAGLLLYRRAYRKAAKRLPEANEVFQTRLATLHALEQAHCASIDRAADAFASLLRACAATVPDREERRVAEQLLYHVGRFLYLTDALEDLPKDLQRGSYNPLRYRYELQDGALTQADREALIDTVEASISLAASALELMPPMPDGAIVHNIVYFGLPSVLHSVAEGTFRKGKHK